MSKEFKKYTTDELKEEIERRESPVLINAVVNMDIERFYRLRAAVLEYVNVLKRNKADLSDEKHYIFETAIEAICDSGPKIWEWINEKMYG